MDVGTRIREHREAAGLRQDQLAELCRVSRQTISNWERNKTLPDIESLKLMAHEFGTTIDALVGDDVPEIAHRADAEARRLLTLYLVSLVLFCLSTMMNMGASFGLEGTFAGPAWGYLRAVMLGVALTVLIPLWRLQKRHKITYYGELGRYLSKSLILKESRATRVARSVLRHLPLWNGALIILASLAGLAAGGMLTLPLALLIVAFEASFIVLGIQLDKNRQQLPGGIPLPPQR